MGLEGRLHFPQRVPLSLCMNYFSLLRDLGYVSPSVAKSPLLLSMEQGRSRRLQLVVRCNQGEPMNTDVRLFEISKVKIICSRSG